MKVDVVMMPQSLREVPALARDYEALGYDGVLTVETAHDPFFPLLVAAEHTERLELGTAVAIAFPRSPMVMANIAWDLAKFSNGRFTLGLGTQVKGHNEQRFSVPWSAPVPRLREYIQGLRAIWDNWQNGTQLDFQGEHYQFTLMTPFFNPGPIEHPNIPLSIAAVNPTICRLAGELCDGIRLHPLATPRYIREVMLPAVAAGAQRVGRSPAAVELTSTPLYATGATEEEVEQEKRVLRARIAFYSSTRTYRAILELHGWGDLPEKLHPLSRQQRWGEMAAAISDEMLDTIAVVGAYDQIGPRLAERYGGLVQREEFSLLPSAKPEHREVWQDVIRTLKAA